jgi:hypothetical protein
LFFPSLPLPFISSSCSSLLFHEELGARSCRAPRTTRSCAAPRTAPRCSVQNCVATLRVALSLALSSEPHYSAAPRTARSPVAAQLHEQLGVTLQLPVAFFFVGLRSNALFFFSCYAVLQHCSVFFFLLLRYRAAVTFLYGGDFFFLLCCCLCFSSI